MGTSSSFADASFFIEQFAYKNVGFNFSGWHNSDYEKLYHKAQNTLDVDERLQVLNDAENVFMDEMPIAPIYFYTQCYLKKPTVHDVALSNTGSIDFKWAYLDKGNK